MTTKWLVIARRRPGFDPAHLPAHHAFLDSLRADGILVMSGPFDDGSGGAYLVEAPSRAEAEALARRDPLCVHGCSDIELRGWRIQAA